MTRAQFAAVINRVMGYTEESPSIANYTDVQLQDLALPEGTLIVSIRRNGTYIVPLGDVKLEPGDELQVSCERGRLKDAKAFFQSN